MTCLILGQIWCNDPARQLVEQSAWAHHSTAESSERPLDITLAQNMTSILFKEYVVGVTVASWPEVSRYLPPFTSAPTRLFVQSEACRTRTDQLREVDYVGFTREGLKIDLRGRSARKTSGGVKGTEDCAKMMTIVAGSVIPLAPGLSPSRLLQTLGLKV
jgi:hypothetical protein